MNQLDIIKIYTITQQQDTNSIQVTIDYELVDTGTYPETRPGAEISRSKCIEIIQSLFSYYCGIMLEISIKRYLKITYIFSSAVRHLPREIFDLDIESLTESQKTEKTEGDCREQST